MRVPAAVLAITLITLLPSVALAFGNSGCNSCGLPPELERQGELLERSFNDASSESLRRQRWAETLCENHPCGEITEEQAAELLSQMATAATRAEDRLISWIGVALGGVGALVAVLAFVQTMLTGNRAQAAIDRSMRTEVLLEEMQRKSPQ